MKSEEKRKTRLVMRKNSMTMDEYVEHEIEYHKAFTEFFHEWYKKKNKEDPDYFPINQAEINEMVIDGPLYEILEHYQGFLALHVREKVENGKFVFYWCTDGC